MNSRERYCFKCDSTIDPNCASELNDTMVEMCPYAERDLGCFHMITDSKVVRGCVVELKEIEKEKCMANDETCKTCFGASCNRKKNFSQCYVTDEPYTPLPLPYYTKASPKFCAKYNDQCFIQVLENDTVIRGCVEEYAAEHDLSQKFLSENVPDNKYQLCSEPLCNEKLDPIYCYSCDSSNLSCTKIRSDFQKQCPLEAKSSGCYHSIKGDYAERGCISELEGDTRTECQSDSEHCKKCIGNYCNNAKGFSRCLWSNQTDYIGVSRLCSKYNDLCITHASDSIRRGCLHDWIEEQPNGIDIKADCENPNICEKCSGQDCNKRFIGREYCLACSSSFECKHFVNEKMRVMCPFAVQSLGCYQRQDNVSSVERGCASSLNPMELSECQSTDSNCKTCLGDSCNNKISFTTCVDCSSEIDGDDCQNNTIFLKEQRCPNYSDQCYIRFENGVITRNCTDNVLVTPKECDKSRDCHLCTGNRCNGRIIEPEVCMVCDSANDPACNSTTVLKEESYIKQCPLSLKEAGCFHYMNRNTEQHVRGCVAKLSGKDLILSHTNRWEEFRTCKGPKCNSEPTLPRCLVCDSREDSNCAIRPNATHSKVCDLYKNECFTLISAKSVVRGCFNDVDKDIRAQCLHDRNKCATYAATDIVGLNKKMVNDFDTCIACDSKTDPDCRSKPKAFKGKICDRIEPSKAMGCYLSIVGDHLTRGCIQDLNPEKAAKCLANSDTCKSCRATDCNSKTEFQECYSCNSQCDPLCARNVRLANTEVCKWYYSKCVTGIDRIGYIHRQCAEQHRTFEQLFSNQFQLCQGDKCNGGVYPANILQCFQCTGDDKKCDMTKNALEPESCSIASVHDQCFTYIGPDKKVFRGCLSDATEQRLLCELVNEHKNGSCVKCDRSGCNKQPKFVQPKLSCMHCTDSEECAFGLRFSNQTMACKNPVVFGDEETCFTHSISGSTEVKRGCTLDANKEDDWCKEEDGCTTCSGSNCNYKNARYSWCVRCISDVNGRCAKTSKLDDYISQCVKSPYPFDKRGCYTNVKNGNVTRGCIADLSDEEYKNCNPQEKCTLCSDDKCNKEAVGSSSVKLSDSILMSFMILLAYLR
ncbi:uncharacterized protein LOC129571321 [Sitodiplosis mosellana]|uniref:uncharacterized protein LOC129571321 n=1 Tax=Sitodiplosis mosellana TaxID=263140 RepID=UPI002444980F|nr:uncharacterized protein LOC129571321 [Sitodiplosis mosellana]